jgi:glycosyl hydrolase family 26
LSFFVFRGDRRLFTRVAVILAAVCSSGALVTGAGTGSASGLTTPVSAFRAIAERPAYAQLGFDPGYADSAKLQALQAWLDRDTSYVVQFAAFDSASDFEDSVWGQTVAPGGFHDIAARTTFVESVPLTLGLGFGASAEQRASALLETLSGAHDASYVLAAQYLRSAGFADVVLRLGWEFDGDWMPWSAKGNEALWAATYRHVADLFQTELPDARLDWTGDPQSWRSEVGAYPGDDYVDIVGTDVYDKGLAVDWDPRTGSWADPDAAFASIADDLTFPRDFAVEHDKQVSYPEWGLADGGEESPTSAGNDDPAFVQGMFEWMSALPNDGPGSLAYHAYFDEDTPSDGTHMLEHFPESQLRFRTLFGAAPALVQPLPIRRASVRPGYSMLRAATP